MKYTFFLGFLRFNPRQKEVGRLHTIFSLGPAAQELLLVHFPDCICYHGREKSLGLRSCKWHIHNIITENSWFICIPGCNVFPQSSIAILNTHSVCSLEFCFRNLFYYIRCQLCNSISALTFEGILVYSNNELHENQRIRYF